MTLNLHQFLILNILACENDTRIIKTMTELNKSEQQHVQLCTYKFCF